METVFKKKCEKSNNIKFATPLISQEIEGKQVDSYIKALLKQKLSNVRKIQKKRE